MKCLPPYVPPTVLPPLLSLLLQYWCWINAKYKGERLAGTYVWMWISLFTSIIMYIPLYLWAEGRFSVDRQKWYKFQLNSDEMVAYLERRATLGLIL
jgi:hypothetical protein